MLNVVAFLTEKLQSGNKQLISEALEHMELTHYSKDEIIIKTGEPVEAYRFLASEGVIRCIYHTAKGKEITECIVSKVGSCAMPSAKLDDPSPIDMQALTELDIVSFPFAAVEELETRYPEVLRMENRALTECWIEQWEMKRMRYEYDAAERYQWFCRNYPGVVGRIKDKHIASFLDMSPVTLSRIRHQRTEK